MTNSDYYCVTSLDLRDALCHVQFFNSLILKNTQRIDGKTKKSKQNLINTQITGIKYVCTLATKKLGACGALSFSGQSCQWISLIADSVMFDSNCGMDSHPLELEA